MKSLNLKTMNKNKFIYVILLTLLVLGPVGCKDQLNVGNPNAPSISANVIDETGLLQYAQGVTYINGFRNGNDWLGNSYFSLPWGYAEIMADNVGASASNNQVTTMGIPDYIILDNGTKVTNNAPQVGIIRQYNTRAATGAGNNAIYYQWLTMYALNNAQNAVLALVDKIPFAGDAVSKANTVKAWCYWWKGYAYAAIGSMYYSGLIMDEWDPTLSVSKVNNDYVSQDQVIARSNVYFNLAATTLQGIASVPDFSSVLGQLIPLFCQVGHGGVLTPDMWVRSINTMLARNILLNKLAPFVNGNPNATITNSTITQMTSADWTNVLILATNGVQKGDFIFTARSSSTNSIFSPNTGTVAALTSSVPSASTFKVSERLVQHFKPTDARFTNNFSVGAGYKGDYIYTTRWTLANGGLGANGVYVYANRAAGAYEVVLAGSYEENALMLAEANIRLSNIDLGLADIDAVRTYLGAGVAPVSGTGLSQVQALKELVSERKVALVFRGLSFYDNRRWGWTYDIANGGGCYGNYLIYGSATNINVTLNYNFMDYWDVPADEYILNPPSASSSPVKNPNY
jgi:starch-binding outer membrane protein, SusD/RagB family